jgi:hypothetical protein
MLIGARRTAKTIAPVTVLYDTADANPTSYTSPATMRIAGAASNPDAWDDPVIRKTYGRHVLGAISGPVSVGYDSNLDAASTDLNAFAEGFGYYMNAAVSGQTTYVDGITSSSANVLDPEVLTVTTPKAPNVAGWAVAALYDLVDGVNLAAEPWDTLDGAAAPDRVFLTANAMSAAPDPAAFFLAWIARGYDGAALAKNFIRHGLLLDDASEPNDTLGEAALATQFGFILPDRFLQQLNEDWFKFTMAVPTNKLTLDVIYDRIQYPSQSVLLELLSSSGALIASGSAQGTIGPIEAVTGTLPAGDYLVRVKLLSGGAIQKYAVQGYAALTFSSGEFQPWTVGRAIDVPVNVTGGIPPYTLTVGELFEKPQGIDLNSKPGFVTGTPTVAKRYDFVLSALDSAQPTPSTASGTVTFIVNEELKSAFGEFQAFALNKNTFRLAPFKGGTSPYTTSLDQGALPAGLISASGSDMRFVGTPTTAGSYRFTLTATDVAGSADTAQSTGVVCSPLGRTSLAAGPAALVPFTASK